MKRVAPRLPLRSALAPNEPAPPARAALGAGCRPGGPARLGAGLHACPRPAAGRHRPRPSPAGRAGHPALRGGSGAPGSRDRRRAAPERRRAAHGARRPIRPDAAAAGTGRPGGPGPDDLPQRRCRHRARHAHLDPGLERGSQPGRERRTAEAGGRQVGRHRPASPDAAAVGRHRNPGRPLARGHQSHPQHADHHPGRGQRGWDRARRGARAGRRAYGARAGRRGIERGRGGGEDSRPHPPDRGAWRRRARPSGRQLQRDDGRARALRGGAATAGRRRLARAPHPARDDQDEHRDARSRARHSPRRSATGSSPT